MTLRTFGLVAACMLAGAFNASAQDRLDKQEAPGKAEMPSSESGKSAREPSAKESAGDRSGGQKSESRGPRDKSAQDKSKSKDSDRADSEGKKDSSAKNEQPKSERNKADNKASREDKSQDKSAQSKSDSKPSDKSASESKTSPADANKSAERDKTKSDDKGRDSSSGTSTGESGSSPAGKLTEDKKKVDEVKNVQVTGEKRDRVLSGFKSHGDIKRVTNVDVNISVGSRAPRDWTFVAVPTAVIEVVPEYRGYVFAYVEDEYVVCDPDTYEIVAVLPASGSGAGYASSGSGDGAKCSTDLTLSEDDRRDLIQSVEMTNEVSVSGVSVGWAVPNDIQLRSLPPRVVERTSRLSGCRYFVVNDQIAIVDPDQDKVVLMIEHN